MPFYLEMSKNITKHRDIYDTEYIYNWSIEISHVFPGNFPKFLETVKYGLQSIDPLTTHVSS